MPPTEDHASVRKGKLSAFQLLRAWLFDKRSGPRVPAETEFLNTRDGHELARFAQKAFGQDAARHAERAAVEAEQVHINALLEGAGHGAAASSVAAPAALSSSSTPAAASPSVPAGQDVMPRTPVELAVRQIELLRAQGLSVETLAEALIIIETREVKQHAGKGR